MRFTIEALKKGAEAASKFTPGYGFRWKDPAGNNCPAAEINGGASNYQLWMAMSDLLWNAAGCPKNRYIHTDTSTDTSTGCADEQIVEAHPRYRGVCYTSPTTWFTYNLNKDPKFIAAIFNSIIACADPDIEEPEIELAFPPDFMNDPTEIPSAVPV